MNTIELFQQVNISDMNGDGLNDITVGVHGELMIKLFLGLANDGVSGISEFNLLSVDSSRTALDYFNDLLDTVASKRSVIGASQSRVVAAISNLSTTVNSYQDAHSRIMDADIATESSNLMATKILQQSATLILAQASLQASLVLKLIK